MDDLKGEVTLALDGIRRGERSAGDRLMSFVYEELRRRASLLLRRERTGHTLQPTALVHEAFLKLCGKEDLEWESRAHFMGTAALAMRQILANHARMKRASKRQGPAQRITLNESLTPSSAKDPDVVRLDEALAKLSALDERQCRIVECRFFGGMSTQEIAHVVDVSTATVEREWRAARAWLSAELREESGS